MARIFLVTLLLSINVCSAQESNQGQTAIISGTVVSTLGPVPYANIYLVNTTIGTVSNESGEFLLKVPSEYLLGEYSVIISSIGFESLRLNIDSFQNLRVVHLQESITQLSEITISSTIIDSADIYLKLAISAIKDNLPKKRHSLEGFYRELSINDSIYTRLIEAAVLIDEPGYKGNSVDTDDLNVVGNRIKIIEMRRSDDFRSYDVVGWSFKKFFGEKNDIYEVLDDNYVRFIGKKNDHFLSKTFLTEYDITTESNTVYEGESVVVIKLTSKNHDIFFNREIEIVISKLDYGIVKIEHHLLINSSKGEMMKYAFDGRYLYKATVLYRKLDGLYVPYYIHTKRYASNTNPLKNDKVQYSSLEFLLTNFLHQDNAQVMHKQAVKRNVDINSLPNSYNEQFWRDYPTVVINPLNERVKNDLEINSSLESQFKKN